MVPVPPVAAADAVAELGRGADSSASTTCCPLRRPLVIAVHVVPITPTCTGTRVTDPADMRFTKWRVPAVVTADEGTASAAFARSVTIETVPVAPLRSFASGLVSPIVTR